MSNFLLGAIEIAASRRRSRRKRVFLAGAITDATGALVRDCIIRQISASGAQVQLDSEPSVPDEVFLIDVKTHTGYSAKVAWRRSNLVGLQFKLALPIDEALPARLKFLMAALIKTKLRQVDVLLAKGGSLEDVIPGLGITHAIYSQWRKESGDDNDDVKRLRARVKELEGENILLREKLSARAPAATE
jgi:hypothetical protein